MPSTNMSAIATTWIRKCAPSPFSTPRWSVMKSTMIQEDTHSPRMRMPELPGLVEDSATCKPYRDYPFAVEVFMLFAHHRNITARSLSDLG